jgi:hypothetical protein
MAQVLYARVSEQLATLVKELAKRKGRSVNTEVTIALENHVKRNALTPQDAQVLAAAFPERY